jgi:hypothetical protein
MEKPIVVEILIIIFSIKSNLTTMKFVYCFSAFLTSF